MTGLDSQYLEVLCTELLQALHTVFILPTGAEDDRAGQPVPGGALLQAVLWNRNNLLRFRFRFRF
jgi:hypothetical protein